MRVLTEFELSSPLVRQNRASPAATRSSHGRLRINTNDPRAEAQAVDTTSMYLRFSSVAHVRAGDDVLRVDHLRGPVLRSLRAGVGQTRPLLVRGPSIMLCEVVDDAVRGGAGPRCGTDFFIKYG